MSWETPKFLTTTLHLSTIIVFPIHVICTYCILFKTPDRMKSVKTPLLTSHVLCCIQDLYFCTLSTPFMLFPFFAEAPLGVLTDVVHLRSEIQAALSMTILIGVGYSIVALFENRFYILTARDRFLCWKSFRKALFVGHIIFGFVFLSTWFWKFPDQEFARNEVLKNLPQASILLENRPLLILSLEPIHLEVSCVIFVGFLVSECFLFTILVLWFLIIRPAPSTSKNTLQLQLKLVKALIFQCTVPLFAFDFPLFYALYSIHYDIYDPIANNCCIILISLHGGFSSMTILLVHSPYRKCLVSWISGKPVIPESRELSRISRRVQ